MAQAHLVVGPVGSGKSTFAKKLCRDLGAIHFDLDEWMTELFRPDRPQQGLVDWYVERSGRCLGQIWRLAEQALHVDTHVVLEVGLIRRGDRAAFFGRVDASGHPFIIHVVDAPREVRRARVLQRNVDRGSTFKMEVSPEIFDMADGMWQPFDDDECRGRDVRFVGGAS